MEAAKKRILTRLKKKARLKTTIRGSEATPRVSVFRSAKHIYAQAIDDVNRVTLVAISTKEEAVKGLVKNPGNKEAAQVVGKAFGDKLKAKGISNIVFDRNGFLYHGRVKSLADGIREAGIEF